MAANQGNNKMGSRPGPSGGGAPNVQAATNAPQTNSTGQGPAAQQRNERRKDNPTAKLHGDAEAAVAGPRDRSKSP